MELDQMDLFRGCSTRDLERIGRSATRLVCESGATLIERGARAAEVIVVISGRVAITDAVAGRVAGPGCVIGMIGVIDGGCHEADVVAVDRTDVLVFGVGEFLGVLERFPSVARAALRGLASLARGAQPPPRRLEAVS